MMDYQNDKEVIKSSSDPLNISFENLSYVKKCGVFNKCKYKKKHCLGISFESIFSLLFFNFLHVNNNNKTTTKQLYDFQNNL